MTSNNIVNIFQTITNAAKYYDIDHNTMSKHIKLGNFINNLRLEAELNNVRLWVYDAQYYIVGVFQAAKKTADFCGTSRTALARCIKSGKLR